MIYVAIIPQCAAPRYLVRVLHRNGHVETPGGFADSRAASAFLASDYPGAIELTPGEFLSMATRLEMAVCVG